MPIERWGIKTKNCLDVVSLKKQLEKCRRKGNSVLYKLLGFFFILCQYFPFSSKICVFSSTYLFFLFLIFFPMNLSLLFSFKTEVWTKITVTSLKSVDFRWCKRLNILFSSLSLFNLPYFLLSLPHMTFPIELLLPCLFFFASFFFFFFSQHFPVNISVLHGQYNWQAGVVPSIH